MPNITCTRIVHNIHAYNIMVACVDRHMDGHLKYDYNIGLRALCEHPTSGCLDMHTLWLLQ